jgi:hypothetical protein
VVVIVVPPPSMGVAMLVVDATGKDHRRGQEEQAKQHNENASSEAHNSEDSKVNARLVLYIFLSFIEDC